MSLSTSVIDLFVMSSTTSDTLPPCKRASTMLIRDAIFFNLGLIPSSMREFSCTWAITVAMSETSPNDAVTLAMDALVLFCAASMSKVNFPVLFKVVFANLAVKMVSSVINFEASTLVLSSSKPTFVLLASSRSDCNLANDRFMTPSIISRRARIAACPNSIVRRVSAIRSASVWSSFPESSRKSNFEVLRVLSWELAPNKDLLSTWCASTCSGDQASNHRATTTSARGTPRPAAAPKYTICLTKQENTSFEAFDVASLLRPGLRPRRKHGCGTGEAAQEHQRYAEGLQPPPRPIMVPTS
mmetsp:Transcript_98982/g.284451  ORF Transcript_98982/g.284451 Transcript_98982/m.284451 type:complete len:300 (+) Transcript_98982:146-1045(+)